MITKAGITLHIDDNHLHTRGGPVVT
jgi:hypothetical protein